MGFRPLTAPTATTSNPSSGSRFRPLSPSPTPAPATTSSTTNTGLFSRIKETTNQSFAERDKNVKEAVAREQAGKQSKASSVFQSVGQAAGLMGDAAFNVAKETVRTVAPSAIPAA